MYLRYNCLLFLIPVHQDSSSCATVTFCPPRLHLLLIQWWQRPTSGQLWLHPSVYFKVRSLMLSQKITSKKQIRHVAGCRVLPGTLHSALRSSLRSANGTWVSSWGSWFITSRLFSVTAKSSWKVKGLSRTRSRCAPLMTPTRWPVRGCLRWRRTAGAALPSRSNPEPHIKVRTGSGLWGIMAGSKAAERKSLHLYLRS